MGQGLLDEHVLAYLQGCPGLLRMLLVRGGQHHSVEALTSDQGQGVGIKALHAVAFARLAQSLRIRIGEGGELDTGQAG